MRRTYEPLVRHALELHRSRFTSDSRPLIGRAGRSKSGVAAAVGRIKLADNSALELDVRRLRNTWLVAAMCSPVPLADLMRAGGLASSRTFSDLLPHCPELTESRRDAVLAAMQDVLEGETPEYAKRKRPRA